MKMYSMIALLFLLFSCGSGGEKETNEENQKPILQNNIVKITLDKNEYVTARSSKIVIEPIIEREAEQSDNDLQFAWFLEREIVSRERNLNYTTPTGFELGIKNCSYRVTNKSTNQELNVEFTLKIVDPYGYGYYFLSEDETKKTRLSYISTAQNSDVVFNTSTIEDVAIGDTPQILSSKKIFKANANNHYELSIVTSKGKYPYIKTNTNTFTLNDKIEQDGFGINFSPSFHMINIRGIDFFINSGEILIYDHNHIYSTPNHGNYDWKSPIESLTGKYIYLFDQTSNKYYQVIPDESGYSYNNIVPIPNSPLMKDEELAGYSRKLARDSQGLLKEEISLLMATTGKLNRYKMESVGNSVSIHRVKTDVLNGITSKTAVATAENGTFYIGIGPAIHRLSSINDELEFVTSLSSGNDIVKMIISEDNSKLIVSTYDKNSSHSQKGSIHLVDLKSNEITTYPNAITKCISIVDCCNSIL